ncbi:uncharacterized protein EI90DRAFT_3146392 [Cantharellus anzutake]|uniref:uncharacterized protein n=1 Tax=Cantharellus anzutake TaxID=1750568 RepID=UPI001907EDB0|nr:uncharacterized protein EI90DRAFT_3146392 [Cantharellus anzutake]KAF8326979.1 hypothetical protein EI90DRAFT_3146392 [Cantharellus anzutake]
METSKGSPEVLAALETISSFELSTPEELKELDTTLSSKTYFVGNESSAADVALYVALHPVILALLPNEIYAYPSILRYVDHIQQIPSIHRASIFPLLKFDLENAPKPTRVVEPRKEKKKGKEPQPITASVPPAPTPPAAEGTTSASPQPVSAGKKEKKKTAPGGAQNPPAGKKEKVPPQPAAGSDAGEPVPSMIDLRVGKIVQVERHPDADGLYVEQIDIGEEAPRTVVSGLVHYIPIEQMRDRTIIVVANLKPANMRGIKSFAMVLCASSKGGKEGGIEFVEPPPGSKPGERVYFEGEKYEDALPVSQMNPKKKIFETIQPGFVTLEDRTAAWIDPVTKSVHKIRTKGGYCAPKTLIGASLS